MMKLNFKRSFFETNETYFECNFYVLFISHTVCMKYNSLDVNKEVFQEFYNDVKTSVLKYLTCISVPIFIINNDYILNYNIWSVRCKFKINK